MRNVLLMFCLLVAMHVRGAAQAPAVPPPPVAPAQAATEQPPATPAPTVPPVPAALPMAGPTGMVFHAIKADKTADFEAVMTRLRDLLTVSTNEIRRRQGTAWRVFRQATPLADGSVLYVSFLEPVVPNAEYDVPRLLAEAAPAEAAQLYEQFRDAHVQPTVQASNLSLVVAPAAATAPKP